jgi:hypothetical protein
MDAMARTQEKGELGTGSKARHDKGSAYVFRDVGRFNGLIRHVPWIECSHPTADYPARERNTSVRGEHNQGKGRTLCGMRELQHTPPLSAGPDVHALTHTDAVHKHSDPGKMQGSRHPGPTSAVAAKCRMCVCNVRA